MQLSKYFRSWQSLWKTFVNTAAFKFLTHKLVMNETGPFFSVHVIFQWESGATSSGYKADCVASWTFSMQEWSQNCWDERQRSIMHDPLTLSWTALPVPDTKSLSTEWLLAMIQIYLVCRKMTNTSEAVLFIIYKFILITCFKNIIVYVWELWGLEDTRLFQRKDHKEVQKSSTKFHLFISTYDFVLLVWSLAEICQLIININLDRASLASFWRGILFDSNRPQKHYTIITWLLSWPSMLCKIHELSKVGVTAKNNNWLAVMKQRPHKHGTK